MKRWKKLVALASAMTAFSGGSFCTKSTCSNSLFIKSFMSFVPPFLANLVLRGIVSIRPRCRQDYNVLYTLTDLACRYLTISMTENVLFGGMDGFLTILCFVIWGLDNSRGDAVGSDLDLDKLAFPKEGELFLSFPSCPGPDQTPQTPQPALVTIKPDYIAVPNFCQRRTNGRHPDTTSFQVSVPSEVMATRSPPQLLATHEVISNRPGNVEPSTRSCRFRGVFLGRPPAPHRRQRFLRP